MGAEGAAFSPFDALYGLGGSHALDLMQEQARRPRIEASRLTWRKKPSHVVLRHLTPLDGLFRGV